LNHGFEDRIHVEQWLPSESGDTPIQLIVVGLVPTECFIPRFDTSKKAGTTASPIRRMCASLGWLAGV